MYLFGRWTLPPSINKLKYIILQSLLVINDRIQVLSIQEPKEILKTITEWFTNEIPKQNIQKLLIKYTDISYNQTCNTRPLLQYISVTQLKIKVLGSTSVFLNQRYIHYTSLHGDSPRQNAPPSYETVSYQDAVI